MKVEIVKIIEIEWDGPKMESEFSNLNESNDYGLFQLYGTHELYGPNTLLYVGN